MHSDKNCNGADKKYQIFFFEYLVEAFTQSIIKNLSIKQNLVLHIAMTVSSFWALFLWTVGPINGLMAFLLAPFTSQSRCHLSSGNITKAFFKELLEYQGNLPRDFGLSFLILSEEFIT